MGIGVETDKIRIIERYAYQRDYSQLSPLRFKNFFIRPCQDNISGDHAAGTFPLRTRNYSIQQ